MPERRSDGGGNSVADREPKAGSNRSKTAGAFRRTDSAMGALGRVDSAMGAFGRAGSAMGAFGRAITTKLAPSQKTDGHLARDHLIRQLNGALTRRLTVIQAGAGYGKTSLLTHWQRSLEAAAIISGWLTLEEEDGETTQCLAYMMLALARAGLNFGDMTAAIQNLLQGVPERSAFAVFLNTLSAEAAPVVLILDDYHRVASPAVNAFIRTMVKRAPANFHLVIATRERPDLGLEDLRAQQDLLELGTGDLRFSETEVSALLAETLDAAVTPHEIHRLHDRTEGWPIALQMVRLWMSGRDRRVQTISEFSGRTIDLARYLSEQVLALLAPDIQEALMRTALPDRVNGALVNLLTGRKDGWALLDHLERQGLFVVPLDRDRQWYRYHHLFADFLRERLARRNGDDLPALHRMAAEWFAAEGEIGPAVEHAIASGDDRLAAGILDSAGGWRLILEGQVALLRTGLARLPVGLVPEFPRLALGRAFLLAKSGDLAAARADFTALIARLPAPLAPALATEVNIVSDILAEYEDRPVDLPEIADWESLRASLAADDHALRASLSESIGAKYFDMGELDRALAAIDEAIAHYRHLNSLYGEIFSIFVQAKILLASGRLGAAEAALRAVKDQIGDTFGASSDLAAHAAIFLAEVLYERNALDEAGALLAAAMPALERCDGWFDLYATGYLSEALVARAKGEDDRALKVLADASAVAVQRKLPRLQAIADITAVKLLLLADAPAAAARRAEALPLEDWAENRAGSGRQSRRIVEAAAAALARLHIAAGRPAAALAILGPREDEAARRGQGRRLIEFRLLKARALAEQEKLPAALAALDAAATAALFENFHRPFIDEGRALTSLYEAALAAENGLTNDRFRTNFLSTVLRAIRQEARAQTMKNAVATDGEQRLPPGEIAVLRELDRGLSNKEIARSLDISTNTVKYRLKSLFAKLGVSSRVEAVRLCRERALLDDEAATIRPRR